MTSLFFERHCPCCCGATCFVSVPDTRARFHRQQICRTYAFEKILLWRLDAKHDELATEGMVCMFLESILMLSRAYLWCKPTNPRSATMESHTTHSRKYNDLSMAGVLAWKLTQVTNLQMYEGSWQGRHVWSLKWLYVMKFWWGFDVKPVNILNTAMHSWGQNFPCCDEIMSIKTPRRLVGQLHGSKHINNLSMEIIQLYGHNEPCYRLAWAW